MATSSKTIDTQRKDAVIYHGSATCKQKFLELLEEFSVPSCVFRVAEIEPAGIEEFGVNRATGFFWLRQKAKTERKIVKIGTIYYDVEITGFIERRRMWKIAGVKAKDMMVSLPLYEILVGFPSEDKAKFLSTAGVYRVRAITDFLNPK